MGSFSVGDVVVLKGGSPVMTVVKVGRNAGGSDTIWTVWFDGSKECNGDYPPPALEKYTAPEPFYGV